MYTFTWVEREGKHNADLAKAEADKRDEVKQRRAESRQASRRGDDDDDDDDVLEGEEVSNLIFFLSVLSNLTLYFRMDYVVAQLQRPLEKKHQRKMLKWKVVN